MRLKLRRGFSYGLFDYLLVFFGEILEVCCFRRTFFGNFESDITLDLLMHFLRSEFLVEKVILVVAASQPEIRYPVRPQKLIVVEGRSLVSTQLVIDFFPSAIDSVTQTMSIPRIEFVVVIERCQVDQPILQKFESRELFPSVVHRLERNKDIEIVFDDVLVEQKTLCQFLVDIPQAVRFFLFVKLFELLREVTLGVAKI